MGVLSYFGILWLVPLVTGKHKGSQFIKQHLNQGIVISLLWVLVGAAAVALSFIRVSITQQSWLGGTYQAYENPWWALMVSALLAFLVAALAIFGIIAAVSGKRKELPIIGKFQLLR